MSAEKLQEVSTIAYETKHGLSTHEKVCAVRYKRLEDQHVILTAGIAETKAAIQIVANRMWGVAASFIAGSIGIIITLLIKLG